MTLIHDALARIPSGTPSAPPDLDQLLHELNVELRYTKCRRAFDGATDLSGDHPVIELAWLAPSSSRSMIPWASGQRVADRLPHHYDARTRFTLAHEIGHVLLEGTPSNNTRPASLSHSELERACDRLAAELLMPSRWFCAEIGSIPDLKNLRRTSLRASVSMSSTIVRARNLGYGIIGLFLSSTGASTGWHVTKTFGMQLNRKYVLETKGLAALESAPFKTLTETMLPIRCGQHDHELIGQMRRTFASAILIAQQLDAASPPAPPPWQCPH